MVEGEDGVSGGEVLVYGFQRLVGQSRRWWVDVVLGMKNLCGAAGYTRIAGTGLGLFKISWGKYLKGSVIFG